MSGSGAVKCSRNVVIQPDTSLEEVSTKDFDIVVLPGGAGGAKNLCEVRHGVFNSPIHKAAGRAVPGFAWYNSCGTEKCPLAVNGSRQQERPPEVVLYGGRPYGGFVNSAVNTACKMGINLSAVDI